MRKLFVPFLILTAAVCAYVPIVIAETPYETSMKLVSKIFYFHVPSWWAMFSGVGVCGVASAIYLFKGRPAADRWAVSGAELAVLFGLMGLVTGPLWGRKAWGVWWQWDARLTIALLLWLVFIAYLLVRKYGGTGSEKLAAAVGVFGTAVVPFVYESVNIWRTVHPTTSVVPTLPGGMPRPFWLSVTTFMLLFIVLLNVRVNLARREAVLDELYLAEED